MTSNSELFFYPGRISVDFILTLLNTHPTNLDSGLYWFLSLIASVIIWSQIFSAATAVIKKIFGFGQRGRYQ